MQNICYVRWTCLSTASWHSSGYQLFPSSQRYVPIFAWSKLDGVHTWISCENEKKLDRSCNFTFRYIHNVFSLNISKYRGLLKKRNETSQVPYFQVQLYRWWPSIELIPRLVIICWSHLSSWTGNEEYRRYH